MNAFLLIYILKHIIHNLHSKKLYDNFEIKFLSTSIKHDRVVRSCNFVGDGILAK